MEKSAISTVDLFIIPFSRRRREYKTCELPLTDNKTLHITVALVLMVTLLGGMPAKAFIDTPREISLTAPIEMKQDSPPVIDELKEYREKKEPSLIVCQKNINVEDKLSGEYTDTIAPTALKKTNDIDKDGCILQIESDAAYPGGTKALAKWLNKSIAKNYPQEAKVNGIQGTVVVQFMVDKEGNICNIEALSGPMELRDAGIKVIKESGRWSPAIHNSRHVATFEKLPIVFKLQAD